MKGLKELMKNAEKIEKDSPEYEAKKSTLDAIKKLVRDMDSEKIKKVVVASPSKEGLEEGLDKAKSILENDDMMENMDEEADMMEPMDEEMPMDEEIPMDEEMEQDDMDEEDLLGKLKEIAMKKHKM